VPTPRKSKKGKVTLLPQSSGAASGDRAENATGDGAAGRATVSQPAARTNEQVAMSATRLLQNTGRSDDDSETARTLSLVGAEDRGASGSEREVRGAG
jgi:hypothetical protein